MSVHRLVRHALGGLALLVFSGPVFAACQPGPQTFDYPAQRLDQALQQFAHTTGCPVTVDTSALGDAPADALTGTYPPAEALIRLVRGSGFEVHPAGDHYVVDHSDRVALNKRIGTLRARLGRARKGQFMPHDRVETLDDQLHAMQQNAGRLITRQGFLSAAEKASYDRTLVYIAGQLKAATLSDN